MVRGRFETTEALKSCLNAIETDRGSCRVSVPVHSERDNSSSICLDGVLDFRDHKSYEIILQNWQQQVCEARNGSQHPNSWPLPGLAGAESGANWFWHVSWAEHQTTEKLGKLWMSFWASFNWTFVKLLYLKPPEYCQDMWLFLYSPTLRRRGCDAWVVRVQMWTLPRNIPLTHRDNF